MNASLPIYFHLSDYTIKDLHWLPI